MTKSNYYIKFNEGFGSGFEAIRLFILIRLFLFIGKRKPLFVFLYNFICLKVLFVPFDFFNPGEEIR